MAWRGDYLGGAPPLGEALVRGSRGSMRDPRDSRTTRTGRSHALYGPSGNMVRIDRDTVRRLPHILPYELRKLSAFTDA
jgi:hypothetical protein